MSQSESPQWLQNRLTEQELQACRQAGASKAFLDVLRTDCPAGVSRHSVRDETKKQLREWEKDPEEMTRLAGHFFTALWEGRMDDARGRADSNNREILRVAGYL